MRDWAESTGWDKASAPPPVPAEVIAQTRQRYIRAYEQNLGAAVRRLAGRDRRLKMVFDVHVEIRGLDGIAGPEGRTIERALPALGFGDIAACASLHEDRFGEAPALKHTFLGGPRHRLVGLLASSAAVVTGTALVASGLLTSSTKPPSVAPHHATTATKAPRLMAAYVLTASETQFADTSNAVLEVQADLGGGTSSTIWMNSANGQYQNLSVTDSRS